MATNQMATLINNIIDVNINNFIINISKKYQIDQQELQELWSQTIQQFQTSNIQAEETKAEETKTEETKAEETKTEETNVNGKHECSYKFTRGKNKGQICGTKTKEEFCSKHRKIKKKTKKNNVPVYQNPADQVENESKNQDISENESKIQDTSETESNMEEEDNVSENESSMEEDNDINSNNLTYDEVEDIINDVLNN